MTTSKKFEAVIGLEIHAQLKTKSKIFSTDPTNFDAGDNENTSPVSVGMPGTLPAVNRQVIESSIKAGLALNCQIKKKSVFARKNYFYPDLPKGYQISQYDLPICENGSVKIHVDGQELVISVTRAHMEEDAGKSTHHGDYTLINYNRAGVPLLEIVSGPDLRTPQEAGEYARVVRQILRYVDVCDGNLEEGSLRCDCNVSVRPIGQKEFGTKVEIKNVNSFRFVEKAIEFEIERQIEAIERGEKIIQETRLWDMDRNRTFSMRTKEDAQDYRYFPDPDLLPVVLSEELIQKIKSTLPELPQARMERFITQFGIPESAAGVLTSEKEIAEYFEAVTKACDNAKSAANWIMTELLRELNQAQKAISASPILPAALGKMIRIIDSGEISGKMGKTVFQEMWDSGKDPDAIIKEKGLVQISDRNEIRRLIADVLFVNQQQVAEYRGGKKKLFGFFLGAVMKATQGRVNPDLANEVLLQLLDEKTP